MAHIPRAMSPPRHPLSTQCSLCGALPRPRRCRMRPRPQAAPRKERRPGGACSGAGRRVSRAETRTGSCAGRRQTPWPRSCFPAGHRRAGPKWLARCHRRRQARNGRPACAPNAMPGHRSARQTPCGCPAASQTGRRETGRQRRRPGSRPEPRRAPPRPRAQCRGGPAGPSCAAPRPLAVGESSPRCSPSGRARLPRRRRLPARAPRDDLDGKKPAAGRPRATSGRAPPARQGRRRGPAPDRSCRKSGSAAALGCRQRRRRGPAPDRSCRKSGAAAAREGRRGGHARGPPRPHAHARPQGAGTGSPAPRPHSGAGRRAAGRMSGGLRGI